MAAEADDWDDMAYEAAPRSYGIVDPNTGVSMKESEAILDYLHDTYGAGRPHSHRLTARLDTGEANIGASMPLESIAACVIAGVSLRGGVGRLENVVLGALFIGLVQNGMNLARIESYLQTVVLGALLILAVIADQIRLRYVASLKD